MFLRGGGGGGGGGSGSCALVIVCHLMFILRAFLT